MRQDKQRLESDLTDVKQSVATLKQRLVDTTAANASVQTRMLALLGQASTTPTHTSPACGDGSGHLSCDETPVDCSQVRQVSACVKVNICVEPLARVSGISE